MEKPRDAVHSFICTHRMHRRTVDNAVVSAGIELHRSQHMLLVHLQRRGDYFSQKELAAHLGISPAALAVKIKKLESDGFIIRKKAKKDSRINAVSITEKGKEILDKTHKLFAGIDKRMISGIDEAELKIFEKCLDKMRKNLQDVHDNPKILEEESTDEMV